ncbi:MAG: asparaginase [Candidatus Zixiibacteriota bacterium]|nr:MAG: asparaginase [candidate division Zixibacteria bacterium]
MTSDINILARVYRGEAVEAVHYGAIAIVDGDGKLTHYVGDPHQPFMTRSSIKPFQIMPLLVSGAADHYGFTQRQLAIMCGSHTGSDDHYEVVMSNLRLAGNEPEDLQCGCHWPLGMMIDKKYPLDGEDKDPVRHNCSGKHSGFLALARFLDEAKEEYLNPNSQVQRMVKQILSDFCEYPEDKMPVGIDGCSAPNYPLPLFNLALGFMKIANLQSGGGVSADILSRIRDAMTTYPEMVSGEKRFDFDLARSFPSRLICKVGAESIEIIGLSDPPLGITIKIHDGNQRALGAVCVSVLKQLGIIKNMKDYPLLAKHERPEIRNYRDTLTGHISAEFELKEI